MAIVANRTTTLWQSVLLRRGVMCLLLLSQLTIGVMGARAAEITFTGLVALFYVTPPLIHADQDSLVRISIFQSDEADTVRPRKLSLTPSPITVALSDHRDNIQSLYFAAEHACADVDGGAKTAAKALSRAVDAKLKSKPYMLRLA